MFYKCRELIKVESTELVCNCASLTSTRAFSSRAGQTRLEEELLKA
jgi:hypothetical protein